MNKLHAQVFNREQIPSLQQVTENGKRTYIGIVKNFRSLVQLDKFIPQQGSIKASWARLAKDEQLNNNCYPISSLYIVTDGEAYLLHNESQQLIKKGDIITIPAGIEHGFLGAGLNGYWGLSIQFEEC